MSQLRTAQGCSHCFAAGCSPAPHAMAVPAQLGTAVPGHHRHLPQHCWRNRRCRPFPGPCRARQGSDPCWEHSLGRGMCWGLTPCRDPHLRMDTGQKKGGMCGLLVAADGWEQRTGSFLFLAPAPGIVAGTRRQRQRQRGTRLHILHLGDRAQAEGTGRGSRSCPGPGYLGHDVLPE